MYACRLISAGCHWPLCDRGIQLHSHYPHPPEDFGEEEESASLVEGRWALAVVWILVLDRPVLGERLRRGDDPDPSPDEASPRALLDLLRCAAWTSIAGSRAQVWRCSCSVAAAHQAQPVLAACEALRQDPAAAARWARYHAAAQDCRVQHHRPRHRAGHRLSCAFAMGRWEGSLVDGLPGRLRGD